VGCSCECGNEPSGFVKGGVFFDWLSDSHKNGLCFMELIVKVRHRYQQNSEEHVQTQ